MILVDGWIGRIVAIILGIMAFKLIIAEVVDIYLFGFNVLDAGNVSPHGSPLLYGAVAVLVWRVATGRMGRDHG